MKPKYRIHRWLAKTLPTTAFFAASAAAVSTTFAADIQWDGSDSTDWATGANWVGNAVPGAADKAFINNITVNTPAVTANATVSELLVGFTSTTGTVNITAGTLTTNSWTVIGNGATGNGTVNVTGSGSLVANVNSGTFQIAEVAGSTGLVHLNTTGSLNTSNRDLIVGNGGNGTLTVDAGSVSTGALRVAQNATGAQGTINLNSGTMTVGQFARWGVSTNAVSDINIAAGTTLAVNNSTANAEGFRMGEGGGSNNTVDIGGTLNFPATQANRIGHNSNTTTATNTVNVNTGGVLYSEGDLVVGYSGGAGSTNTLNIDGGTVNVASASTRWMVIGNWDALNSTTDIKNGGFLNLNAGTDIKMGMNGNVSGTHTINVDGGTLAGTVFGGNGTDMELGRAATTGNYVLNIKNGGQANLQAIYTNSNSTSAVVNFDNGTLKALGNDANWIRLNGTGTKQVNILAGGATFDSNGFDVTIGNIVGGTGALTKAAAGKLTLGNVPSYTGATQVNAGTLVVGGAASTSGLNVAAGATLGVEQPATPIGSLTVATATFANGATLNIETGASNTSEKVVVSGTNGLTFPINGGEVLNVNLYQDGGTSGALGGTYTVFEYTGFYLGDPSNITVANPRPGYTYNVLDTGTAITIEVIAGDTDGDGMDDTYELANGLDPADDGTVGESSPGAKDGPNGALGNIDGDFATNYEEYAAGTAANNANDDPNNTDNDGLKDSDEVTYFGNITAQTGTNDFDGDLVSNVVELYGATPTLPNNGDSWPNLDTDGMNDAWEVAFLGSTGASDGTTDTDGDGFTDKEEHDASTDPSVATGSGISPIWTELKHRWSFNGDLLDSVGGSDATIVDVGANEVTLNSTSVTMTGGTKASSDYVKLGENLLPNSTTPVTIELWAKQNTIQNWSRIFDFHTSTGESLMMAWTQGTNNASDRVEWVDSTGAFTINNAVQPYGTTDEHHIVMTLEPLVGSNGQTRVTVYAAPSSATDLGAAQISGVTAVNLVSFQDALNALGYSPWPDNTASATYNEVRIWNGALAGWMVEKMHDLGPDSVTVDDLDGDHLPDAWEAEYAFNATSLTGDDDSDTFSNYDEYVAGTDPTNILSTPDDTDADGLLDAWEITHFGNLDQDGSGDPDGDGLTNEQEETGMTNPTDDEDGLTAAYENFWFGSTTTQTGADDSDADGFTNAQEVGLSQPNNIASTPTDVNGDLIADSDPTQHTLAASDALGTTSFNAGLNWDDSAAPVAGGTYIVKGGDLRTPTAAADITFAGDRLDLIEVWNGLPKLLLKYGGSTSITTTFPFLNLNGGEIQNAADVGIAHKLAGTINIDDSGSLTSRFTTNNGGIIVDGVLTGSGRLEFTNGNSVTLNGVNTFTGNLNVINDNGLILGETGSLKFVPTTNGVNNAITGTRPVVLNGTFDIDLGGASVTPGDEWDLITNTGALTIGATFTVNGFTPDGGAAGVRIWTDGTYSYDEATGILSVGVASPDADSDGMDDDWETTYFGGTSQTAEGDFDGDSTNNLTEFRLGLIPNDGSSIFKATRNAAGLIEWPSVEGVTFDVQRSTNLSTWTTIATVPGTAGTASYTDPAPPAGKAFYRVLLQP